MTKDEILQFLSAHKEELRQRFGVKAIGLFGSYARGEARDESDVDIIVELPREDIADGYFGLLHYLEDSFHKKVDLGLLSTLKPTIRPRVLQEVIYV